MGGEGDVAHPVALCAVDHDAICTPSPLVPGRMCVVLMILNAPSHAMPSIKTRPSNDLSLASRHERLAVCRSPLSGKNNAQGKLRMTAAGREPSGWVRRMEGACELPCCLFPVQLRYPWFVWPAMPIQYLPPR